MDPTALDRVTWQTLSGAHAQYSEGGADARRYALGFSPIVAFADPARPNLAALARHCRSGERFYCDGWSGPAPGDWRIELEATMFRMVWDAPMPEADAAPDAVRLGAEHVDQAIALATLTQPGPFGRRTIELGEYYGVFDGERLVAMAGERMQAGPFREISGVCTHPDQQGRGHARHLMLKLIRRELQRGERPFLHVMSGNAGARALYRKMGFRDLAETVVRVIAPQGNS